MDIGVFLPGLLASSLATDHLNSAKDRNGQQSRSSIGS